MSSIRINRVYTRSGDDGATGLVGGTRVSKNNPRVCAYGEIDELNSVLGVVKEFLEGAAKDLAPVIENLQQELFDLGSELATPAGAHYDGMWRVEERHVQALEKLCDRYNDGLPELTSFILPGGNKAAGFLHLARVVCRRAERSIVSLREVDASVESVVIEYVNRLSDLLFIFARWVLAVSNDDVPLWVTEAKRRRYT